MPQLLQPDDILSQFLQMNIGGNRLYMTESIIFPYDDSKFYVREYHATKPAPVEGEEPAEITIEETDILKKPIGLYIAPSLDLEGFSLQDNITLSVHASAKESNIWYNENGTGWLFDIKKELENPNITLALHKGKFGTELSAVDDSYSIRYMGVSLPRILIRATITATSFEASNKLHDVANYILDNALAYRKPGDFIPPRWFLPLNQINIDFNEEKTEENVND